MSKTSAEGVALGVTLGVAVMVLVAVPEAVAVALAVADMVAEAVETEEKVALAVAEEVAVAEAVCVGTMQMPLFVLAVEALRPPKAHTVQAEAPAAAHEKAAQAVQLVAAAPELAHWPVAALRIQLAVGPA